MIRLFVVAMLVLASPASAATGVIAIGDFGVGGSRERAFGEAVRTFEAENPAALLLTLGDNDYTEGSAFASSWQESFGWLPAAGVRVAGSLGNHDVEHEGGRYEFAALGMPGAYYVRRVGAVEAIVLNSNDVSRTQTRWLRRVLARRTTLRRIVVFHHPPYTCGGHSGSGPIQRAWVPLFRRSRVRLVLSGHDHNYQRFVSRGITYVVHGGGGARAYALRTCPSSYPPRVAARVGQGFVYLQVTRARITVRVVDVNGATIDRFDVT